MVLRVRTRNDLQTFKKQKRPNRTDLQFNQGIERAKYLNRWMEDRKNSCVIEDDETYIKMDFSTLPGPQYYTKKRGTTLDENLETIGVEKFGPKRMVWQAICQCGSLVSIFYFSFDCHLICHLIVIYHKRNYGSKYLHQGMSSETPSSSY